MTSEHVPPALAVELRRLTHAGLAPGPRLGYVGLLLFASAMTVVVGALWITEPELPARTSAAMGALAGIGLCWAAFAAWVLTRRRALFARHRVVAGRMAVAFTALFTVAAAIAVYGGGGSAASLALATGVGMLAIAVVALVRAHRTVAALVARREALERELGARRAR